MEDDLARIIEEKSRPWLGYWHWADKQLAERDAAEIALTGAGIAFSDLRSRPEGEDPPDCEAVIDGTLCGIEVTELVDERALRASLKALKAGTPRHAQYRVWDQKGLRVAIQARIDRKDDRTKLKGGPYDRYLLVIVTDEIYLNRASVEAFLTGVSFQAGLIADAFLCLSYHPADPAEGSEGSCPVFRLSLDRRL